MHACMQGWTRAGSGGWVKAAGLKAAKEGVAAFDRSLQAGSSSKRGGAVGVVDFDEHVDDSSLDFLHQPKGLLDALLLAKASS